MLTPLYVKRWSLSKSISCKALPRAADRTGVARMGSSLSIQSRAVSGSFGIAEGDRIAPFLPFALTCQRFRLVKVRKLLGSVFHFRLAFCRIRFCDRADARILLIPRGRLFFCLVVRLSQRASAPLSTSGVTGSLRTNSSIISWGNA